MVRKSIVRDVYNWEKVEEKKERAQTPGRGTR